MELKWYSRKVKKFEGTIGELRKEIPYFRREPFRIESEGTNQYLDIIVREPLKKNQGYLLSDDKETHIPIATVSKQYALVQHHDVLDALETALKERGIDPVRLKAELKLTEYGECMWVSFILPTYEFNPGDGYPLVLKLNGLNSVDKTKALEIKLAWYRLVCSNGLMFEEDAEFTFRKFHRMKPVDVFQPVLSIQKAAQKYLSRQLESEKVSQQIKRFEKWYSTEITSKELSEEKPTPGQIEHWIDNEVRKKWGAHAATRVYHIAKTGYDGKIVNPFKKDVRPHEREVSSTDEVPGAFAPVRNTYDISQVLSWIAGQRGTIQEQFKWMTDIPYLIDTLLKTEKPLTLQIEREGSPIR